MINLTNLKDFKNLKGDFKEQIIFKFVKEEFSNFLDELEEATSIEKYGNFIIMESKDDWKYDKGFLGLSEGILNCIPEIVCLKSITINNSEIELYKIIILLNNDFGIDIYFEKDNCPEDIFKHLVKKEDVEMESYNMNFNFKFKA